MPITEQTPPPLLPASPDAARTTSARRVITPLGRSYFAFPRGWGRAAAAALGVLIGYNVLYMLWLGYGLAVIQSGLSDVMQTIDLVGKALRAVGLVVLLANAVCFLGWQWTVVHNQIFFGNPRPRYGAGFTCFSWFLPIANLFIPYQSLVDVLGFSGEPFRRNIRSELRPWWILCLATGFFWALARILMSQAATPQAWAVAGLCDMARALGAVAAAVLAIRLIRELSERQQRRYEIIAAATLFD